MSKKIVVLGSTGSIGVQTLEVAENIGIEVIGLSANSNIELLKEQAVKFKPKMVAIGDVKLFNRLKECLKPLNIEVVCHEEGLRGLASMPESDVVVNALVGTAGLLPTLEAIKAGKDVALANKEALVTAGSIIMSETKRHNVKILPIDSEHSAIYQCLEGNDKEKVQKLVLTASGGPFRGKKLEELQDVTLGQALKHPNWSMGSKITIDSATMMNKGLEVIEARWLFDIQAKNIEVVIHPQSIIHSMVEYIDGSYIAQMGLPDMRLPIQYALTYGNRVVNDYPRLDLKTVGTMTFEEPDVEAFRCLKIAYAAIEAGGTMPAVMNAANEEAVRLFLQEKIKFLDIPRIIEKEIEGHSIVKNARIEDIINIDKDVRRRIHECINDNFSV